MKFRNLFSLLAAVTLFSAPAAEATADISVSMSGPGAGTGDTIYCGRTVTFNIHFSNTTGASIFDFNNGFRIYSPDGATWTPLIYDTTGGLDAYFTFVVTNGYSVDGMDADTVRILGAAVSSSGLPDGYNDIVLTITTEVDCADTGLTVCIDSSWFSGSGGWLWADSTGALIVPSWGGRQCFTVDCKTLLWDFKSDDKDEHV